MAEVQDYQRSILAALISSEKSLQEAQVRLDPDLFDPQERSIFNACVWYYETASGLLDEHILLDILRSSGADDQKQAEYLELFRTVEKEEVDYSKFRYSVDRLQDEREKTQLAEVLATSMKILTGQEVKVEKDKYRGLKDAKAYLDLGMTQIRGKISSDTPEGDIRKESEDVWKQYLNVKEDPESYRGIMTGFSVVDEATYGMKDGELWIVAAYAGEGKSVALMNIAWEAAVKQGKNVFVATAEMPKNQWRARLYCRHTQWEELNLGGGMRYTDIARGLLTPDGEEAFYYALQDLSSNKDYGNIYVLQLPHEATIEYLRAKMRQIQTRWNIDLLVVDYLSLMKAPRKRVNQREELDDLLIQAKQLALGFNDGKGVPLLTAHQTNRSGYEAAQKAGRYNMRALSGSSETEKSADVAFWLLSDDDSPDILKAGFLKIRDGEKIEEFELSKQFSHMLIEDGGILLDTDILSGDDDFGDDLSDLI